MFTRGSSIPICGLPSLGGALTERILNLAFQKGESLEIFSSKKGQLAQKKNTGNAGEILGINEGLLRRSSRNMRFTEI